MSSSNPSNFDVKKDVVLDSIIVGSHLQIPVSAPSNPSVGDIYFNALQGSEGTLYVYNGTNFGSIALM